MSCHPNIATSVEQPKRYSFSVLKKRLIADNKKVKFYNNINKIIKNKKIQGYIIATPVQTHFTFAKNNTAIRFLLEKNSN